jgi:hypothetical protein
MSSIEEEIAAVKAAAQKRLHRLRERERKEQQAIDQRVIMLIREQNPAAYEAFCAKARAQIQADSSRRSERARRSPSTPSEGPRVNSFDGDGVQERFGAHADLGGTDVR